MKKPLFAVLILLYMTTVQAADPLDAFPAEVEGKQRHVIQLPKVKDESRFMIELVPGRREMADCNLRSFTAPLRREVLAGWGYPYYVLSDLKPASGARKICAPSTTSRRFIRVRGDGLILPYSSRLPLVVYLPEGVLLKYRVWRADKNLSDARTQ
ncbi:ecotin family protein [Microbulbifer sp. 2205BS26-8]|uniref:ecotin family protein n=1 Tax=Microbulbifer sp. 2205BS26-8 TaxID=3064386 RepID=UPI00273F4995|nr:ecotin family protein [Microbulbifer sp. 2205BS26-8]MDP5210829.1 ecotin family protein [Microbulbifer sp. 2205BS26-8]